MTETDRVNLERIIGCTQCHFHFLALRWGTPSSGSEEIIKEVILGQLF